MKKIVVRVCLVSATFIGLAQSAAAADTCGLVKTLTGSAKLERGGSIIPIAVGLAVQSNDRVSTAAGSSVGISLSDDTLLALGPNSALNVDHFAFNQTTHEGGLDVRLKTGVLRMVTGLIAKHSPETVKVKTPNAVVGVRGTDFIVEVPAND